MSTDVNDFDQYLQKRPYCDLLFRAAVWLIVSMVAGYLAIYYGGSTALSYFQRVGNTLAPLLNCIGVVGLLMCVLGLFLKDLEATSANPKIRAATHGMLCGFVRRFAGDISLWTLGALITMLSVMILALLDTSISRSEYRPVGLLFIMLGLFTVFTFIANVYVRRLEPTPLAAKFKNSTHLSIFYTLAFVILLGVCAVSRVFLV